MREEDRVAPDVRISRVLQVKVDATSRADAVRRLLRWSRARESPTVSICNVHVVVSPSRSRASGCDQPCGHGHAGRRAQAVDTAPPGLRRGAVPGGQGCHFAIADVSLCPCLVGLAAPEAFAAAVPLFKTDIPVHFPYIEYLHAGKEAM